jgi:single-strand DNA-binding protein
LIGNVGKDPVVKYFDNGNAVANFPVATSDRGYTLANGIEVPERTEWHNIVVSRDRAQFVEKFVRKGSLVYVEGKIRTRNYDDQSGIKRYITEIYADRIEFYSLGKRPDSTEEGSSTPSATSSYQQAPSSYQQAASSYQQASPYQQQVPQAPPQEMTIPPAASDSPDDLPF